MSKKVQTKWIADSAVTVDKLGTNAVETAKIKDLNVTVGKLATDAVETAKIKDGNVTGDKLASSAKQSVLESKLVALRDAVLGFTVTAASSDTVTTEVEAAATTDDPQTDLSAKGIYTGAITGQTDPKRVLIRAAGTDNAIDDGTGDDVFGVLTEVGDVFTLSYKKADNTAYTFGSTPDIDFYFVEIYDEYNKPTDGALLSQGIGGVLDATSADVVNLHLNGGTNKHDATEIDYEEDDGNKLNIQAASDSVETAITDLDQAIGTLNQGSNYTAGDVTAVGSHLDAIDTVLGTNAAAAATADGKAVSAQGDATQALSDASDAQSAADAAQGDATQALSDASTADGKAVAAQGDATQALSDASDAQSAADAAQGDATQALSDASTAQSAADAAQGDATTALAAAGLDAAEKFTLDGTDITNKYVVLAQVPKAATVIRLVVMGGMEQDYAVDFAVTADDGGKRLSWDSAEGGISVGMEADLAAADILRVWYEY